MDLRDKCQQCGGPVAITNAKMTTIKKYCSRACRNAWWNDARNTGFTWGDWADARFGKPKALHLDVGDTKWLAGVIDGEGTIGIYRERRPRNKTGYRYKAVVSVSGTHVGFIKRVAEVMGGFECKACKQRNPRGKPLFKTVVSGRKVSTVLTEIAPHLIIKQEQAIMALEFLTKIENAPRRTSDLHPEFEALYQRMKTLNKRGV